MSTPKSAPFRIAVDPIRDSAPSYLTIIKHPMDLGTIQAKFSSGMYKSRDDYAADVRLIVTNACTYNTAGSPMFQAAKAFEETFERSELLLSVP
jgi:transcription initiation factor TFIID subunit 2